MASRERHGAASSSTSSCPSGQLEILALHVKECNTAEYEKLSDSEPELSNLPPDSPDLSPATEEKIEETSDLSKYSDQIMSCGYTGPINEQNKENIKSNCNACRCSTDSYASTAP
ncbi:uncharacterized protein isoform X3 [Danio rerio]|uniref:Uncharacterized protein isoform X3 n=1 Tax=Danio rerio TaxID=7955 RepID=A0AC58JIY3_DANRE